MRTPSIRGPIRRRDLIAAGGLALAAGSSGLTEQSPAAPLPPLDIAEWSFFWAGVERADLGHGPVVNGKQMYVEYQVPAKVRHPYPIVLVHGGPFPQRNITLEQISGLFTPRRAEAPNASPLAKLHTQWPGTGEVGSPELSQLVASQGGSYGNGPGTLL